jgi:enoyl-CoA hydratase/carnithine racemase
MTDVVIFSELSCNNGKKIGHATLNKESALNALNIDMIKLLKSQLELWQQDPQVCMVLLDGVGDKAFCAGGDVVAMHNAMQQTPSAIPASLQEFFTEEYKLDYLIHSYQKPFMVWGHGIVMGGGLGLMSGASHRIVTATSRIAMPEISIGLYPDVGGSWFLNKMPEGCGLFLGLTGASVNAADALYTKLADHFIAHSSKAELLTQLSITQWTEAGSENQQLLSLVCERFQNLHIEELPKANVAPHQAVISELSKGDTAAQVVSGILALQADEDKWLSRAQSTLKGGSPITANLVFEQLRRGENLSLAECFAMELTVSCRCGEFGEFQEGVRARLIDKDNQPNWRYKNAADVPESTIEYFFTSPWAENEHPLLALGK